MCTCDHEHPHGNPYFGCHVCVYDSDCKGDDAFCRNKTECAYRQPAGGKGEVPEGYRRIGTGTCSLYRGGRARRKNTRENYVWPSWKV